MEFEQLEMGKKCLINVIERQDVADYHDILHPKVLVVSHFRYPPSPPVVSDTIPVLASALRRPAVAEKTAPRSKSSTTKQTANRSGSNGTAVTRKTMTSPKAAQSTKKGVVLDGADASNNAMKFGGRGSKTAASLKGNQAFEVDMVEGPLRATERLYVILEWMNKGSHIAETRVDMEVRKVILQESEVLPPPPPPSNERERIAQLGRQHTDRNQRLSRLTVTFGRNLLLFRDECYFEDGFIVTVHRFMLTNQEMLALVGLTNYQNHPQVQQRIDEMMAERENFYIREKIGIDSGNHATLPLLDFTFCNIPTPLDLFRVQPVAGKRHVQCDMKPELDTHLTQGVFLNQQSDLAPPPKDQRVIVKARNKQGDEEVYEFIASSKSRFSFLHDQKNHTEDVIVNLAEQAETYAATNVRIRSCGMTSADRLVPVLRRLVANAIMTIRSLDLSDNHISVLPDFSLLPLQRLQLHQNKISDWEQVESRVCPLPLLQAVTLHGNPISENEPQYWQSALARLLRHPRRAVPLRQLDFVTLTRQDYNMAGAFEMFMTGNQKLLNSAREGKFSVNTKTI